MSRKNNHEEITVIRILSFIIAVIMTSCNARSANTNVELVSPEDFQTKLREDTNAYLLDVRKPVEFEAGHLKGANLLNWLDESSFKSGSEKLDKTKTIYVYCRSGRRSNEAANYLAKQGYKVVDMDGGILAWNENGLPIISETDVATTLIESQGITHDSFTTQSGKDVSIHFIKHASLILEIDGKVVYIDPVGMYGNDFTKLPKADAVMVTHEHHDHFDPEVIEIVSNTDTKLICNGRVAELGEKGEPMAPGNSIDLFSGVKVTATPAYNITEGHLQFHPKERKDVGFLFDIDGLRIYVAGDTEDSAEMTNLKDVDIAFIPVNQPYTMTPQQAINAINMIQPKIVYPYHYGDTDLTPIVNAFKDNNDIEVRIRELQ